MQTQDQETEGLLGSDGLTATTNATDAKSTHADSARLEAIETHSKMVYKSEKLISKLVILALFISLINKQD